MSKKSEIVSLKLKIAVYQEIGRDLDDISDDEKIEIQAKFKDKRLRVLYSTRLEYAAWVSYLIMSLQIQVAKLERDC